MNPGDDLQAAINAAVEGSTLRLCPGTFKVTRYLEVEKNLTIVGAGRAETILDGEEKNGVLIVGGSRIVTVEDLTITRGNAGEGGKGGGIINNGDLTLRRTAVTFCKAFIGGGIMNFKNSVLTLDGGTKVERNTAGDEGGGIFTDFGTVLMKEGSFVSNNTAQRNGGGILTFGSLTFGYLTLNAGSFVEGNTAIDGDGGGIRHAIGPLTIDRRSTVLNNHPDNCQSLAGACPEDG